MENNLAKKTMCPGQDTRYWRPGDIYDVPCQRCGRQIEFFKDDASRLCTSCGSRISNPKLSLGCAQWCDHAKECLGYDPKSSTPDDENKFELSLVDRIIDSVKRDLGQGSKEFEKAIRTMEMAEMLLKKVTANPKVVIAASLLIPVGGSGGTAQKRNNSDSKPEHDLPRARNILLDERIDRATIDDVCAIINAVQRGIQFNSIEFNVVHDAYKLTEALSDANRENNGAIAVNEDLKTAPAREIANTFIQAVKNST